MEANPPPPPRGNAEEPPQPSTSGIRQNRPPRFRNKKPYSKDKNTTQVKPTQPQSKLNYSEKPVPITLSTRVIKYFHPIHTGTAGIDHFSRIVYATYAARDRRLETAFPVELLAYVSSLALTYRIASLGSHFGYNLRSPTYFRALEEVSKALVLPEPIAKYIESVGSFQLSSGICLVPYVPTAAQLASNSDYLDLATTLEALPDFVRPARATHKVFISTAHVSRYMMGAAIGAKFNTLFRKVDWSIKEGSAAFIASYTPVDETLVGHAPQEMEQAMCQLGACYRLRNDSLRDTWIGSNADYRLVQDTPPFDETIFILDQVMNHMMSRHS